MIDPATLASFSHALQKEASAFSVKGLPALRRFTPRLGAGKLPGGTPARPFSGNQMKVGALNALHLATGSAALLGVGVTANATREAVKNRYADPAKAAPGGVQAARGVRSWLNSPPA